MARMTGAEWLVQGLLAEGAQHVFGIASGKLAPLMHALSRAPQLRFTGVRHEAAGAMMAAAVNAATGQLAVALGEMGPGTLNLAAGAGLACNNHLPALWITTNQHRAASYPHSGMFMDLDSRAVLAPLTRWGTVVGDGRRLPALLHTALRQAFGPRPGPVHLDIPQDVLAASWELPDAALALAPAQYRVLGRSRPSNADIEAAVALIRSAQRPLIVAGGGVVAANAHAAVRQLAGRLNCPVATSQMGLGIVASSSAHSIGQGGLIAGPAVAQALAQADLVISLGCRWSSWLWDEQGPLLRQQPHIAINTDPQALGQPARHTLALCADVGLAMDDLLAALGDGPLTTVDDDWLPRCRERRLAYEAQLVALAAQPGAVMHPASLAQAIANALPEDSLAVYDGGHTSFWSNDFTPVQAPRTRFHDPGMCQLGFGLPQALALQLLHPRAPVFNLTGDGSFGFTVQELDSARRHGLNVVNVIHNNQSWGVIRAGQRKQFDFEFATALEDTDYAAIARGFGCHGERVDAVDQVGPAIARALASGLPAVLDCRTRFEPHPCMPAFGAMNRFGFAGA